MNTGTERKVGDVTVRDLTVADYSVWLVMWKAYCTPWVPSENVTTVLWKRLIAEGDRIGFPRGLVAVDSQDRVIGLCHYVLHTHTWGTGWWCHCEDLFVLPEVRNGKVGRALLQSLLERGRAQGWDSIYGTTDKSNAAQFLYSRFTPADDRLFFSLDLKDLET